MRCRELEFATSSCGDQTKTVVAEYLGFDLQEAAVRSLDVDTKELAQHPGNQIADATLQPKDVRCLCGNAYAGACTNAAALDLAAKSVYDHAVTSRNHEFLSRVAIFLSILFGAKHNCTRSSRSFGTQCARLQSAK